MAEKKNPLGATGETAASNVKRIRESQRLSYAELSRMLEDLGRPIATLGLSRIENGARRIDADDLVALAVALGVSPITLLTPHTETSADPVTATGVEQGSALRLWQWMRTERPLDQLPGQVFMSLEFQMRAKPAWLEPDDPVDGSSRVRAEESRARRDRVREQLRQASRGDR